ncbi:MAG: ABC transporter ATP-binding protein [Thermostichales cyanobacterium SZTDM-1c_bins_54]
MVEPDVMIELCDVSKRFGSQQVLDHLNLKIYRGESLAIVGPSGTGKSTVLRLIAGLIEPDSGKIYWRHHESLQDPHTVRIGMVFQQAALFDSLTVAENVGFWLYEHSRLSPKQIRELVTQTLAAVGLHGIEDRMPENLSGGQRKRVSFARAILNDPTTAEDDPQVLLYDEPTAGLDPIASTVIEDLICDLQYRQKVCDTSVVVTHQESTIRRTASRVVLLAEGRVQWEGKVEEIDHCQNPYVRQFFSGSTTGPIQVLMAQ